VIWNNEPDEKKDAKMDQMAQRVEQRHASVPGTAGLVEMPGGNSYSSVATGSLPRDNVRDSQMYKRILNQSLKQAGVTVTSPTATTKKQADQDPSAPQTPHLVPPKTPEGEAKVRIAQRISGLSPEDNRALLQEMAEMAATAATVAARDATKAPRRALVTATTAAPSKGQSSASSKDSKDPNALTKSVTNANVDRGSIVDRTSLGDSDLPPDAPVTAAAEQQTAAEEPGGHDAPNWSRTKSAVILLTATVAYAVIAEILVDTVDAVLTNIDIDEKFLGITLFALVPNTTEFLNAISFAMNGNVALSMEIGSSYALQVILLQAPALILFSAIYNAYFIGDDQELLRHSFTLIFPQWDMVTVILSVFLMGWVIGEGKSNYFKGSTLILTYLVIVVGFYFSGFDHMEVS
jgi:Ca2+:H+ antiporter